MVGDVERLIDAGGALLSLIHAADRATRAFVDSRELCNECHAAIHDWYKAVAIARSVAGAPSVPSATDPVEIRMWAVDAILGGKPVSYHGIYINEVTENAEKLVNWVRTGEPIDE